MQVSKPETTISQRFCRYELLDYDFNNTVIGARPGRNPPLLRLLPPLIIGEEEIALAVAAIDRACTRLAAQLAATAKTGAVA